MAKPSWLNITPESGSGNGTIVNSCAAHTGRVARSGTVTVTAEGVATPVTYKVTQTAKPEFVSFDNGTEMSAPKTGGAVLIRGKSNSDLLSFTFVGEPAQAQMSQQYYAAGSMASNNQPIDGDPGAQAEYDFELQVTLPENDTVEEVSRTVKVSAGGKSAQIVVKQTAGDARISIDPTEITIPQDGSAVSVEVSSNTSWSVA